MKLIETELARIIKPFDPAIIWRALDGEHTLFDVDAAWSAHYHGQPRTVPRGRDAFDGDALLAAVQTIAFLGTNLAAGDARREALGELDRKLGKRLANPTLLLFGGLKAGRFKITGANYELPGADVYKKIHGVDTGALVASGGYLYFRPALLEDATDIALGEKATELIWPNQTFGFSGLFGVVRVYRSSSFRRLVDRATATPLSPGQYETDPRCTVPELVPGVEKQFGVSTSAAALYLQLLTLCDAGDKQLRAINGSTPAQHKKAVAELADHGLVETEKKPRANRAATLPGNWERLKSPQPAIETWKLPLFDARIEEGALWAPLGRLLPVRPIHETFEKAWNEVLSRRSPKAAVASAEHSRQWVAEIAAAPEDEAPRQVYADHLTDLGDPRGELISLQLRRNELARAGESPELSKVCAAETALLAAHEAGWIEKVYSYVEAVAWDRGFIHSITIHGKKFAKSAEKIFAELPLLREVTLLSARRNHIDAFVGCPSFERIRQLDFTPEEHVRDNEDLAALLDGKHFPRLEWLRIGFHRPGEGVGGKGAKLIADCERLEELRFLEVAGHNIGAGGAKAIVSSKNLRNLEVLRLPLNGIRTGGARQLLKLIEKGALPRLRVLDLGNVVETNFVTKAVLWHRNRVDADLQRAIVRALGERHGESMYEDDPSPVEPAPAVPLAQGDGFPFAAVAKSGRSSCVVCEKKIEKGGLRLGVERELEDVGRITGWLHPECRGECAELRDVADLEERLVRNSDGLWPPPTP